LSEANYYETDDVNLAAYLLYSGHREAGYRRQGESGRVFIRFNGEVKELRKLEAEWVSDEPVVKIHTFLRKRDHIWRLVRGASK